jgi:hypothetical protein
MSLATLLNKPCLLVRRSDSGGEDAHGNPIEDETVTEVLCEIQQRQRSEDDDAGELSDTLWTLFLPHGTDLDTSDAVIVGGLVYEVMGDPWDAVQGSPDMWHVEATVRRTAGSEDGS